MEDLSFADLAGSTADYNYTNASMGYPAGGVNNGGGGNINYAAPTSFAPQSDYSGVLGGPADPNSMFTDPLFNQPQSAPVPAGGSSWTSGGNSMANPAWLAMQQQARKAQADAANASGEFAINAGKQLSSLAQGLGDAQNPFDQYRSVFAKQLMQLQSDPGSISRLPGYLGGLEGVQRSMASQGYQDSGNMMAELQKYSGDFYQKESARLAGLAGANAAPGAGAATTMAGMGAGINLQGQGQASKAYATALQNPIGADAMVAQKPATAPQTWQTGAMVANINGISTPMGRIASRSNHDY